MATLRHIACEGRCFVLGANQFVTRAMYPPALDELDDQPEVVCRGGSVIVSPLGDVLAGPVWDREEIVYADPRPQRRGPREDGPRRGRALCSTGRVPAHGQAAPIGRPMKLLLFSDLHCGVPAARRMVELARGVDVAIGAGDFGQVRRKVGVCIDILRDLPCPAVVVPGNNESLEELRAACSGWAGVHVLHGSGVEIDGVHFFGLGGGVPMTPFGSWSWDFSEVQAAEL